MKKVAMVDAGRRSSDRVEEMLEFGDSVTKDSDSDYSIFKSSAGSFAISFGWWRGSASRLLIYDCFNENIGKLPVERSNDEHWAGLYGQ